MGNTLTVDNEDDNRFNESVYGKTIKQILLDSKIKKNNRDIKDIRIRACCQGAITGSATAEQDSIKNNPTDKFTATSIQLPEFIDEVKNATTKASAITLCNNTSGSCLKKGSKYIGLQAVVNNKDEYCSLANTGANITDRQSCDNYIINRCAKNLYDQGCIYVDEQKKAKFNGLNNMCFSIDGLTTTGPPECGCLNSMTGYVLNTRPQTDNNPYNLTGINTSSSSVTPYSLNVFNTTAERQYPVILDPGCKSSIVSRPNNGLGYSYLTKDYEENKNKPISLCLNDLSFNNIEGQKIDINKIQLQNNCGGVDNKNNKEDTTTTNKDDTTANKDDTTTAKKDDTTDTTTAKKDDTTDTTTAKKDDTTDTTAKKDDTTDTTAKKDDTPAPAPITDAPSSNQITTQQSVGIGIGVYFGIGFIILIILIIVLFIRNKKK